ncbi:MAG: hypothetical protein ACRDDF_04870, partial [Aeromonas sp.]
VKNNPSQGMTPLMILRTEKGSNSGTEDRPMRQNLCQPPQNSARGTANPLGTTREKAVRVKNPDAKQKEEERIYKILGASPKFQSRVFICDVRVEKNDLRISDLKKALTMVCGIPPHGISTIIRENKNNFKCFLSEEHVRNYMRTIEKSQLITILPWCETMLAPRSPKATCLARACCESKTAPKNTERRGKELMELLKEGDLDSVAHKFLLFTSQNTPPYNRDVALQ